jgi:hypothetical protein
MEKSKIHPSHKMRDNDWGDDRHCMETCEGCSYSHCYVCRTGDGIDDDELQVPCIGFPWYEGVWKAAALIGRKSGTGWPKKPA